MGNILDYVLWRGDLSFDASPFNEVDNLILSKLSYLNFTGIVRADQSYGIPLDQAAKAYFALGKNGNIQPGDIMKEELLELFRLMADSRRFSELILSNYDEQIDLEKEMQFAALTIHLGNHCSYVAFRGTDDTLVGWKEDFNMSVMEVVPSQKEALAYYLRIAKTYENHRFILGGHSKGGNLAVFAAVHAPQQEQARITAVYNNDGPGFHRSMFQREEYKRIAERIVTIIPQSSIIGMLLEHEDNYTIVKSSQKGFLQHFGYNWEVQGTSFVHLKNITQESQLLDITLRRFLYSLSIERRAQFTDTLFEILASNENRTLNDIRVGSIRALKAMLKTYESLDKDVKKAVNSTLTLLFAEGIRSIREVNNSEEWKGRLPVINLSLRKHKEKLKEELRLKEKEIQRKLLRLGGKDT
ncbi:MAG TPA: DUF2974 domain-containing protein [Clostridiales bacterium]|nr:DUF2974 domain-containing protein [Clostridiales bacterium]